MDSRNNLKTTYNGIEIAYNERENRWEFELRNRERFAESLAKAKEAIDKPAPESKKKFERIEIYHRDRWHSGRIITAEVTSIARDRFRHGDSREVWVTRNGERSKTYASACYPVNDHNTALVNDINALEVEINRLKREASNKESLLEKLDLNKYE